MTEKLIVTNKDELQKCKQTIISNVQKNADKLGQLLREQSALDVFSKMKFDRIGVEPISGAPENIIEVINQLQTYLVSIDGVEYLLEQYPEKQYCVNWGNISGYDIESLDGEIIAECFAARRYQSNSKLTNDLKRLANNKTALFKYEFFYDAEFTEKQKITYEAKYQGVQIIKLKHIVVEE